MVRLISKSYEFQNDGVPVCGYVGLSTDDKPVHNIATGSNFYEIDTGKMFMFDEEADVGSEWIDQDFESGD